MTQFPGAMDTRVSLEIERNRFARDFLDGEFRKRGFVEFEAAEIVRKHDEAVGNKPIAAQIQQRA